MHKPKQIFALMGWKIDKQAGILWFYQLQNPPAHADESRTKM